MRLESGHCRLDSASVAPQPQIVAWSDPNDLLSWEVPPVEGVHVVDIPVHNQDPKSDYIL
jgi:hypothetical protein